MQKLLIDENLSPSLIGQAVAKGFVCSHINHLSLTALKDWELKATILEGDWTFITNNGTDFRGPAQSPGSRGVYAGISLHAGLICIDALSGLNLDSRLAKRACCNRDQPCGVGLHLSRGRRAGFQRGMS